MARVVTRCGNSPTFAYQCTRRWDELLPIEATPSARLFGQCRKPVHLIEDEGGFAKAVRLGLCVAIDVDNDESDDREVTRLMGMPSFP